MRRLAITILSTTAALTLAACGGDSDPMTEGWSGGITDGTYRCSADGATLGDIQIEGARYGGFSAGWRGAYSVADDGSVEFSEGLDNVPAGLDVQRATWTVNPNPTLAVMLGAEGGETTMILTCTPVAG